MHTNIVIAVGVGLLGYSSLSFGGLKFRQVTTVDGAVASVSIVTTDATRAKAETLQSAGDNPFMPPGSYMLFDDSGMVLVNPAQRTFARFDPGMMAGAFGAPGAPGAPGQIEFKDVRVEKVLDEPGESIGGYATRHYRFESSWTMGFAGVPMTTATSVVEDLWATTELDLPTGAAAVGVSGLPADVAAFAEAQALRQVEGLTLRHVSVQTTKSNMTAGGGLGGLGGRLAQRMGSLGGNQSSTTTIEILDIEESDVPAETFAIPSGYQETSLFQTGPALPSLNSVDEAPSVPSLNDLND